MADSEELVFDKVKLVLFGLVRVASMNTFSNEFFHVVFHTKVMNQYCQLSLC